MSRKASISCQEERRRTLRNARDISANEWFKDLYDYYSPVRAEIAAQGIGEDEVNADIDAALQEVRGRNR